MSNRVGRKKALNLLVKNADRDPAVCIGLKKNSIRIDRFVSPMMMVRTEINLETDGFLIDTKYGVQVKPESRSNVLDVLNRLNGTYLHGRFALTEDGDLVFRNFLPCFGKVDIDLLEREAAMGSKMFLMDMADIMDSLGPAEEDVPEYKIV